MQPSCGSAQSPRSPSPDLVTVPVSVLFLVPISVPAFASVYVSVLSVPVCPCMQARVGSRAESFGRRGILTIPNSSTHMRSWVRLNMFCPMPASTASSKPSAAQLEPRSRCPCFAVSHQHATRPRTQSAHAYTYRWTDTHACMHTYIYRPTHTTSMNNLFAVEKAPCHLSVLC